MRDQNSARFVERRIEIKIEQEVRFPLTLVRHESDDFRTLNAAFHTTGSAVVEAVLRAFAKPEAEAIANEILSRLAAVKP